MEIDFKKYLLMTILSLVRDLLNLFESRFISGTNEKQNFSFHS